MNRIADTPLLEESDTSSLSGSDALSRVNLKEAKKLLKAHFSKKNSNIASKMPDWVNQLKKMPDSREEVIQCVNLDLLENPNAAIKTIVENLSEELF